jgi:hypothetical protein
VPATEKEAGSDAGPLIGHKGTVAASMEGTVAADTFNIGLDFAGGNPVAADVAKWNSDVAALRSYCKGS